MPIKIGTTSEEEIKKIPFTGVVAYSGIIDFIKEEINKRGFIITSDIYKTTTTGDSLVGIYVLNKTDKEDKSDLTFYWTHGYNNLNKFRCCCGTSSGISFIIPKEVDSIKRRSSDPDIYKQEIVDQINKALDNIGNTISDIESYTKVLEDTSVNIDDVHEILGELYLTQNILSTTQIAHFKSVYKGLPEKENLLSLFDFTSSILMDSHPRDWFNIQQELFIYFQIKSIELKERREKFLTLESVKRVVPYEQIGSSTPSVIFL